MLLYYYKTKNLRKFKFFFKLVNYIDLLYHLYLSFYIRKLRLPQQNIPIIKYTFFHKKNFFVIIFQREKKNNNNTYIPIK